jgi:hypothetical protein
MLVSRKSSFTLLFPLSISGLLRKVGGFRVSVRLPVQKTLSNHSIRNEAATDRFMAINNNIFRRRLRPGCNVMTSPNLSASKFAIISSLFGLVLGRNIDEVKEGKTLHVS